ncbi:hypothetical protein R1flu_003869 [Riccia fluitans]|uniref:Uncharacterized protein n=1 Tax=Riccia fluitans TaxID=41844 RepID=A0ABD1YB76_9MARC
MEADVVEAFDHERTRKRVNTGNTKRHRTGGSGSETRAEHSGGNIECTGNGQTCGASERSIAERTGNGRMKERRNFEQERGRQPSEPNVRTDMGTGPCVRGGEATTSPARHEMINGKGEKRTRSGNLKVRNVNSKAAMRS